MQAREVVPMRINPRIMGKAAVAAVALSVVAVFLQWVGLPVNWPDPPHTLYSEIAHVIG
jgi:hypothetical protein